MRTSPESDVEPRVHSLYEQSTGTWQHIVCDPTTLHAVVIDPVLDKNSTESGISTVAADNILALVRENGYVIDRILETHANSNHRSSAWYLRTQLREETDNAPRISIGKSISGIQRLFEKKYGIRQPNWADAFDSDFSDGEVFSIGALNAHVLRLPGNSSNHTGYLVGRNIFLGDLFPVDLETLRAGSLQSHPMQASQAMQRLMYLPRHYRVYNTQSEAFSEHSFDDQLRPFATIEESCLSGGYAETRAKSPDRASLQRRDVCSTSSPMAWHENIRADAGD